MSAPTLINLPPPPSDPVTPSEMGPGTPNSATTSMSELSTVAIKDGHRGHLPHHAHHPNPLDAERADRISRLAGLERVATTRQPNLTPTSHMQTAPQGYFDATGNPAIMREKSTVGSASATGSIGGRTTWASESDAYDRMSESQDQDHEMDTSSVGGFSTHTEGAESLVGFGEGARTPARGGNVPPSPGLQKATVASSHLRETIPTPMSGVSAGSAGAASTAAAERQEARMIDGMTYDAGVIDTASRTPPPVSQGPFGDASGRSPSGAETAQTILRERMDSGGRLGSPEETEAGGRSLGRFEFERE